MVEKHLRQELLSEYHDVWTSGLTFYEHPNDPYQPVGHVFVEETCWGRVSERTSGRGEGKKQTKLKYCADALSA